MKIETNPTATELIAPAVELIAPAVELISPAVELISPVTPLVVFFDNHIEENDNDL